MRIIITDAKAKKPLSVRDIEICSCMLNGDNSTIVGIAYNITSARAIQILHNVCFTVNPVWYKVITGKYYNSYVNILREHKNVFLIK